MVNVTIDDLLDGENTRLSSAVVPFNQSAVTFKGSIRPNTPGQINVTSQAQLEDELGPNLDIPAFTDIVVVYDAPFTQTKPFIIGEDATLQVQGGQIITKITYTDASPMFQNADITKQINSLIINGMTINGNNTGTLFNINAKNFIFIDLVEAQNFVSRGEISALIVKIQFMGKLDCGTGLVIKNTSETRIISCPHFPPTISGITDVSIIFDGSPLGLGFASVIITDNNSFGFASDDSLFFLDPNPPPGSSYIIEKCAKSTGNLFQPGTDIVIDSVANNTSGKTRFTTATSHGLVVGRPVVLSAFATETTYNGTFIVTAVDTPITGTTFDVEEAFTATDTGNMNTKSLDSTDILVIARDNPESPDSMTIAESASAGVLEVDGSGDIDVPIVDVTPVPGDWVQDPTTERFSVDPSTGVVTYNGLNTITVMIKYSLIVEATSGPAAQNLIIDLHINGVPQPKAAVTVTTAAGGVPIQYNGGNFEINTGDTFQLFKDNTSNTNNTNVTKAILLINLD